MYVHGIYEDIWISVYSMCVYVLVCIFNISPESFHFEFACQLILFFVFLLCLIAESCYLVVFLFF